uniref:Uncharacterized protein n=1 Tax=Arundo donax TaxID=35708 RepID=A0A0A9AKK7_ARUDO
MPPHLELGFRETFITLSSSAVELAEMGIKLTPSKETWFADMSLSNKSPLLFGELSLTPLFLNDFTACWLVNMAALEASTSLLDGPSDGFIVSSYLSLLAMLMDKEEDVHELRAKHLIVSFFSNEDMLAFFKGLAKHLRLGIRYFAIIEKIVDYKRDKRVPIVLHKFVYHNFRIILTLLSIASVLVGIFKAILSLKQP